MIIPVALIVVSVWALLACADDRREQRRHDAACRQHRQAWAERDARRDTWFADVTETDGRGAA